MRPLTGPEQNNIILSGLWDYKYLPQATINLKVVTIEELSKSTCISTISGWKGELENQCRPWEKPDKGISTSRISSVNRKSETWY